MQGVNWASGQASPTSPFIRNFVRVPPSDKMLARRNERKGTRLLDLVYYRFCPVTLIRATRALGLDLYL